MGAREVWQMFPSVIYPVTISPRLFFLLLFHPRGSEKCSVSLVLSNYSDSLGCVTPEYADSRRIDLRETETRRR